MDENQKFCFFVYKVLVFFAWTYSEGKWKSKVIVTINKKSCLSSKWWERYPTAITSYSLLLQKIGSTIIHIHKNECINAIWRLFQNPSDCVTTVVCVYLYEKFVPFLPVSSMHRGTCMKKILIYKICWITWTSRWVVCKVYSLFFLCRTNLWPTNFQSSLLQFSRTLNMKTHLHKLFFPPELSILSHSVIQSY